MLLAHGVGASLGELLLLRLLSLLSHVILVGQLLLLLVLRHVWLMHRAS